MASKDARHQPRRAPRRGIEYGCHKLLNQAGTERSERRLPRDARLCGRYRALGGRFRRERTTAAASVVPMPGLKIVPVTYRLSDLEAWKDGNYAAVFGQSKRWGPLERLLADKARRRRNGRIRDGHRRGDARFFGEAVAAKSIGEACLYGSFKWLTSNLWVGHAKLPGGYKSEFRNALHAHFGPDLAVVRAMAIGLSRQLPLTKAGRHQKPVAPDLWLAAKNGSHRFIEVKLSDRGDTISESQLAGMAVIATCLGSAHVVSVEVFNLHCEREKPSDSRRENEEFERYCEILRTTGARSH